MSLAISITIDIIFGLCNNNIYVFRHTDRYRYNAHNKLQMHKLDKCTFILKI